MSGQQELSREELRARLNAETGKIDASWLKPHFKSGALIELSGDCDLVDIAASIALDDSTIIRQAMEKQQLTKPQAEDLERWEGEQAQFWSVVVAPFVLVQRIPASH